MKKSTKIAFRYMAAFTALILFLSGCALSLADIPLYHCFFALSCLSSCYALGYIG